MKFPHFGFEEVQNYYSVFIYEIGDGSNKSGRSQEARFAVLHRQLKVIFIVVPKQTY